MSHVRDISVLGLLFVAASAVSCSPTHRVTVTNPPSVDGCSLPIEFHFNLPVVNALVEGEPARLIVDVGGHDTVTLTKEAIERLGVTRGGTSHSISLSAAGKLSIDKPITIRDFRLGDVMLTDVEGHEIDFGGPPEFEKGIDGYVGAAVLRRFVMLVDYPRRIVLYSSFPSNIAGAHGWPGTPIDDRITSRGRLSGRAVRVAWDTGANRTVVTDAASRNLPKSSNTIVTGSLALGSVLIDPLELRIHDISGANVDVILGHNVFISHRVIFDFPSGQIFVEPPINAAMNGIPVPFFGAILLRRF